MDFKYAKMDKPKRRKNNIFNIFVRNSANLADIEKAISEIKQQDDLERIIYLD